MKAQTIYLGPRRRLIRSLVAAAAAGLPFTRIVHAAPYPARPIKIIVGGLPGGGADGIARFVAKWLGALLSSTVVVENYAGAGGTIAADLVARAPADGYTLLLANQGTLTLAPSVQKNIRYDPLADFTPIGRVVAAPYFIVVSADVKAQSYRELVELARSQPGRLTFGSTGDGTVGRLVIELVKARESVDILAVPYKGAAAALTDLLAGRIDVMFLDIRQAQQHVRAGKLRFIAATGSARARAEPNVPTILEQSRRGFAVEPWFGLVAPARIPAEALDSLSSGLTQILGMPDAVQHLEQAGYEVVSETPKQFEAAIRAELKEYSEIVSHAGLRAAQ